MYLHPLMVVCQWWQWMKQARSESLGADQHWDLVKWSLVTLCSTGEGDPPLTVLAQCLALVQPHTPSPTSILVECMKWEFHQEAVLDWVDTAVGVGSKLQLTTVSIHCRRGHCRLNIGRLLYMLLACRRAAKMPLWLGWGKLNHLLNFTSQGWKIVCQAFQQLCSCFHQWLVQKRRWFAILRLQWC